MAALEPIAKGASLSLYLPTTPAVISALYDLHHAGRRNAFGVVPPTTQTVDQWAQTFRRGFHQDAAVIDDSSGRLLGYVWTYDYAPEHGTCELGAMFRPDLHNDDDGLRHNLAHLEGLALWVDLLFDEWPLDVIGLECSERALAQFSAFLPRLFHRDGARPGWLRHGAKREDLSLWSMTRETWEQSRFARGNYWKVGK